jgi:membrane-bound metal-dependent hydrolase YbcI (DUF457 family)
MYPVTHMTIGVGGVWLGERLWRRWRGGARLPAIDYRFAAVGALVPDFIDKPLGKLGVSGFGSETAHHAIGHTLLVSVCIILVGILLARRGNTRLLVLGLASITHPMIDPTNTYPGVLFWPLFGADFPASRHPYSSYYQIPLEILLAATYAMLVWRSARWRGRAWRFLTSGTFPLTDNEETEPAPLHASPG